MGFEEDHKIQFEKPKTFAYRADVDELADYFLRLLKDEDLREKMGTRAREHAVEKFEYHKIAKQMANKIKERFRLN